MLPELPQGQVWTILDSDVSTEIIFHCTYRFNFGTVKYFCMFKDVSNNNNAVLLRRIQ